MKTYSYKGYKLEKRDFISYDEKWNVKEHGYCWAVINPLGYIPFFCDTIKAAKQAINERLALFAA